MILVQIERWQCGWGMQVERSSGQLLLSGGRVSNTWITCLVPGDNGWKRPLIPNEVSDGIIWDKSGGPGNGPCGIWEVHAISACWGGKSSPRLRRLGGLRDWPPTLGLRNCPDSYGRLQSRIIRNERKLDDATLRERWRPSGCKVLSRLNKRGVRIARRFEGKT